MNGLHWSNILLIALGGGTGAAFRYVVSTLPMLRLSNGFPLGTLTVNLLGCFLIGLLYSRVVEWGEWVQPLILIGFLGGFTTFATFGLESYKMMTESKWILLSTYILVSNIVGFFLVFIGAKLANV